MQEANGRVYDIDYLANQGWVQISIREQVAPGLEPLFVHNDYGIQNALQAAMMSKRNVVVKFDDQREVQEVRILAAFGDSGGNVKEFQVLASGASTVSIESMPAAHADDLRCQLLICTAIATSQNLEYVEIEGAQVVRAKINFGDALK
jgi:hypothetical protein